MDKEDIPKQAKLFGVYLVGEQPSELVSTRYEDALRYSNIAVKPQDKALLAFIMKHPWVLRFVDAGLALIRPYSEVRRRLYVMFAVLESTPEYADFFFSQKRRRLYIFTVIYSGVKATLKTVFGMLLVKVIK